MTSLESINKMLIVTGASSFIGRNFIDSLKQKYLCLVRKKSKIKQKQVVVDFFNKKDISKNIKKGDVIVHILGITNGSKREMYDVNYLVTKNLVDASKGKAKKIIFISSAITEMKNSGDYGKSKLLAENYIKKSDMEYIILKPSIVYGKENKMIGRLIQIVKKSKFVPIIGSGDYKIAPVYITDLIKIIKKSIKMRGNKEYVIAGEEISMNELVDRIAKIYSAKIMKIKIPIAILKFISFFGIRGFPDREQLNRITKHPKYNTEEFKKDFNIDLIKINKGLNDLKCQGF